MNPRFLGEILTGVLCFLLCLPLICLSYADTPSLAGLPIDVANCSTPRNSQVHLLTGENVLELDNEHLTANSL